MSRREAAEVLGLSVGMIDKLIAAEELTTTRLGRRVVIQPKHVREFLEANVRRKSQPGHEDAAEIASQITDALRLWMNGDRAGWARIVNESRFPVRTFAACLFNVVAKFAAESDDREQFLALVGELVARD